ncbi:MAG TPA: hemerythrin domain-containing protein [Rhodanobacteraceae bacterium]
MPPTATPEPPAPEHSRPLGRSRPYTATDLSARLRHWHAPRINRWEQVRVTAGTLAIEYLEAGGVRSALLGAGALRWFAPGTRWRVVGMPPDCQFEIGVHADTKGQAEAPQPIRSQLLEAAQRETVADADALRQLVATLPVGAHCIVTARFDVAEPRAELTANRTVFWHPLGASRTATVVMLARAAQPFDLAAYLGRDHAVIEAALGGALIGDAAALGWLHRTLERHLHIEEELIFPAYVAAGGDARLTHGLMNEHKFLRQYLGDLDEPLSRRKFLRLLDGHDEKEEGTVYPDILAHLGAQAAALLPQVITWPV